MNMQPNYIQDNVSFIRQKGKWSTGELIIGIVSIVLFFLISLQSCAASIGNTLSQNGELSGSYGLLTGFFMMVAGIVAIPTKNSIKNGGAIATCILFWLGALMAFFGAGSYTDLKIWGFVSFSFGFVFLLSIMKARINVVICVICSFIYFFYSI